MNAIGGSGGSKQASSEREASTLDLLKQFESQLQSANQSGKLITVQLTCYIMSSIEYSTLHCTNLLWLND